MTKGIVYCVTNPTMPDLVKIGLVESAEPLALKDRVNGLYITSVPVPFVLHYAVVVDDFRKIEGLLHNAFSNDRVNPRREFFRIDPERVVSAMKLTGGEEILISDSLGDSADSEVTKIDKDALEHEQQLENKRLSAFTFSTVNISPGEELTFSRDDSLTAQVINERTISFEGKETSLSAAATEILARNGSTTSVAGPLYWMYRDETLAARRRRIRIEKEAEEADQ